MDGNPSSQGYYLCNRPLSYGQMLLIADGIESIDNIQADAKVKIYEALKKITGFDVSNYIYEKHNKSNDDIGDEEDSLFFGIAMGVEERLHVINKALETVKMLTISNFMFGRPMYQCLLAYIEGNEKLEIGKLQDDQMYRDPVAIAPYRLFRNCRDEIWLAFYVKRKGKVYPGYFPVNEPHQIALVDKPKSLLVVKDEDALFPTDMINSTTAKEYQNTKWITA